MQHINFYSQLDRAVTPPFAVIHQLAVLAVALVSMLCLFAFLSIENKSLADNLRKLQQQNQVSSSELEQLKSKKQKLLKSSTLKSDIEILEQEIRFKRDVLANVDPQDNSDSGFSRHLIGLARQSFDGLWFTQIMLQQGGSELVLMGRSLEAEYLPQYLQKLSVERVFSGHQFRVMRMTTPMDGPDQLNFELRATDSGKSYE